MAFNFLSWIFSPRGRKYIDAVPSPTNGNLAGVDASGFVTDSGKKPGDFVTGLSASGKTVTYTKGDGTTGSITTQDTNTTYSTATTGANGLMSAADKSKLDGIASGANAYSHPSYTAASAALIKVGRDASGHVVTGAAVAKADITALGIPAQDTTYSAATTGAAGLMSAADKVKLNGVATGATANTVSKLTATIGTSWSGSAAPFTQTIGVSGVLATDTPLVDIVQTGTEATDSVMRENWGKVTRITTGANSITVYASAALSTSVPIQLKVVR